MKNITWFLIFIAILSTKTFLTAEDVTIDEEVKAKMTFDDPEQPTVVFFETK